MKCHAKYWLILDFMRDTHSKKVGTGSNKRPEKLNVHIRNSWRTNLQLIRSIGNMIGYKKSLSEWQCLSEVKMGRGSPIPPIPPITNSPNSRNSPIPPKTRDEAFRSGDKAALKTARANLSRGIKNAKRLYGSKINNHFTNSRDTRSLWQGIQTITDYKPPPQACDDDTSLPDALNHFYSRFEMQNNTSAQKLPTPPNDQALCLSPADVRKTLSRINPRKAAGPDNIPGRVLKDCAEQLTDVLTDIFNISLSQAVIPTCLKSTTIIPVPKKITCVLSK